MKKVSFFFVGAIALLMSFVSCNGITDIYANGNANVVIKIPGGNNSRSAYEVDEVISKITDCEVKIYKGTMDSDSTGEYMFNEPPQTLGIYKAGSKIRIYLDPDCWYRIGMIPYCKADGESFEIYNSSDSELSYQSQFEKLSDSFMLDSSEKTVRTVSINFELEKCNIDNIVHTPQSTDYITTFEQLKTAIDSISEKNTIPTRITLGYSNATTIEFSETLNIGNKKVQFRLFQDNSYGQVTFTGSSSFSIPLFSVTGSGEITTYGTSNLYINTNNNVAFNISDNGKVSLNTVEIYNVKDTCVSVEGNGTFKMVDGSISVASDAFTTDVSSSDNEGTITATGNIDANKKPVIYLDNVSLRKVRTVLNEAASANLINSTVSYVSAASPAINCEYNSNLYLNNVSFANCASSKSIEENIGLSDSLTGYSGIVRINYTCNENYGKKGRFEFNKVSTSGCSGTFIATGSDIILGDELNFDSIYMANKMNSSSIENYTVLPRIFLNENIVKLNEGKTSPIYVGFNKIFTSSSYTTFNNVVNGISSPSLASGSIYPEFFLREKDNSSVTTFGDKLKISKVFAMYPNMVSGYTSNMLYGLSDTGIFCRKLSSTASSGFDNYIVYDSITINNTHDVGKDFSSPIHYYSTSASDAVIKGNVFPYFNLANKGYSADQYFVVFDGTYSPIVVEGTREDSTEEIAIFKITNSTTVKFRNVNVTGTNCAAIELSSDNSSLCLENCMLNTTSENEKIKPVVITGKNCTVNITGKDPEVGDISIQGSGAKITTEGLYCYSNVELNIYIDESTVDSYKEGYQLVSLTHATYHGNYGDGALFIHVYGLPDNLKYDVDKGTIVENK